MMPSTAAEGRVTMEAVYTALEQGAISDGDTLNKLIGQVTLPKHPRAKFGQLPNGLAYCILPNAAPAGRFECHLEVCAGSADELISQQGMAHMCEHVSYMGSKKRERLFGTSSQTNAQTDFHHTVYWASCPKYRPSSGTPMLPLALDALCDVMEAKFEPSRVEKERSAILSEAAMVNTIDYRVEVQVNAIPLSPSPLSLSPLPLPLSVSFPPSSPRKSSRRAIGDR
jgi:secreted Zn-dependent insulinase-like peptidase